MAYASCLGTVALKVEAIGAGCGPSSLDCLTSNCLTASALRRATSRASSRVR